VELLSQESAISVVTLAELHGLPVMTQDDDFAALEGMTGVVVVSV
jgi:predicted nucleic acid-binding protein